MLGRSLRSLPTAQARGRPVPGACSPLSPPPRGLAAPSPASAQRLPQTPQVRTHLRPPLPRGGWYHPRCGWPGRQALPGRGAAAAGDAQWVYGERGAPSLFKSWGPYGPPPRSPPRSLSQALAACLAAVAGLLPGSQEIPSRPRWRAGRTVPAALACLFCRAGPQPPSGGTVGRRCRGRRGRRPPSCRRRGECPAAATAVCLQPQLRSKRLSLSPTRGISSLPIPLHGRDPA